MELKVGREYIGFVDPWTDEERLTDEEITRCKDCIYSEPERTPARPQYEGWLWCEELDEGIGFPVLPEDFCAWGERAGDES